MILEVLRSVTDWLNDVTNGVAAQLAAIPLDGSDTAPGIAAIADETRDNSVAQQYLPRSSNAGALIAVNIQEIPLLDPEVETIERDGLAKVLVRVGVTNVDTKDATRDTSYVLRAIVRSLRLYNAATRTRNAIAIYSCEDLRVAALWQPKDDQLITGAVAVTWRFRDTAP
jgi:hypothetical protein